MMTTDELKALWSNPDHWNRDTTYRCTLDPRLFVPKRRGGGWTLNMAHSKAQRVIWLFLLGVVGVVAIAGAVALH